MSGDRLAQIEADARKTLAEDAPSSLVLWKPWAMDRADDVLALVEIARATESGLRWLEDALSRNQIVHESDRSQARAFLSLGQSALARLDSGAAEEQA